MNEIDRSKLTPGIDAKIARLDAKLRAQGKMQDADLPPNIPVMPARTIDAADHLGTVPDLGVCLSTRQVVK